MLGFEPGMARDMGRSHCCLLLLLVMACISLTVSDGPTCPMEVLENTTVDIKPAVTKGARGDDPVHVETEENCLEKCCSSKTTSGLWNCSLVIFDSRKTGNHPNCYLFQCPTDEACPTKPTAGVTSYRVIQDNGQATKSLSNAKNKKPTYVNVNKKKPMALDSEPPDAKKMEHVNEDRYKIKSITSKILGMAENIEKQLDKMDHSLEEKQENPVEKKKTEKPTYYPELGETYPLGTAENAAVQPVANPIIEPKMNSRIPTTTLVTTSTTTRVPPKTTTSPTTTHLLTTKPLPTTSPLATTTPFATTTFLPTTTPLITTTPMPTTTFLATTTTTLRTTSRTTTTPVTTTSTTAMLVTKPLVNTLSTTTLATTTSVANPITTTSKTTTDATTALALPATPVMKTIKPTHLKPKNVTSNIYKVTSSKVGPSTRAPEFAIGSAVSVGKATETQTSSRITPQVIAVDSASVQNVNKDLHGAKTKILENINSDSHSGDMSGLVAALVFGVCFSVVVLFLVVKRAMEAMRRRHYSRLDYLINGMYIDT